jgi:ATP-dependent DNA helicase RecQ
VPDAPVPDDVVAAVVKVLAAWHWDERPAGIVSLPSRSRPQLITSFARRIAEIGRMPDLGALEYAGGRAATGRRMPGRQYNSAQRLRAVWDTFVVPGSVRAGLAGLSGPLLLIDDQIDSGWTLTVAAMQLREAGATAVLPLVLATAVA